MQINCEHPKIIINPLAKELISRHGNYFIRGKEISLTKSKNVLYDFKTKNINPIALNIGRNALDSCFVLNRDTQERYPLYIEVPCGRCNVCHSSKVNALVHRCKLETIAYKCKPIFITLTYDKENLPKNGVSKRDCQLFFKRFRINLFRKGYRQTIRYLLVSEYGKQGRAHYHAILWNLGQSDMVSYREIGEILSKSWNCGFEMHRLIDPGNDKAFFYTSKYLAKGGNVPEGQNSNFCLSSRRGGGIGAPFIDRCKEMIQRTLDINFKYVNQWNSKVEKLQFNRYILNRVFPTLSRSVTSNLKNSVRNYILNYQILKSRKYEIKPFSFTSKEVADFFGQYFYCPVLESSEIKATMENSTPKVVRDLLEEEIVISRYIGRPGFFARAVELDSLRKRFLLKLFEHAEESDMRHKGYLFKRMLVRSLENQVL